MNISDCYKPIGMQFGLIHTSRVGSVRPIVARRNLQSGRWARCCYGNSQEENCVNSEISIEVEKGDGASSGREMTLEELEVVLKRAVNEEDYATAVEIRDKMGKLKDEDPVLRLEKELKEAVEEGRYVSVVRRMTMNDMFALESHV